MRSSISILLGALALTSLVVGCGGTDSPNLGSGSGSSGSSGNGSSSSGSGSSGGSKDSGSSGGGSGSGSAGGGDLGSGGSSGGSTHKRVFVTSTQFSGDLGGASGADAKCQLAANGQVLGGTFKAWISTSSANAIDRIADVGPWYLVDGYTKVFNNKANLQTVPLSAIWLTEANTTPTWTGYSAPWTGSDETGANSGWNCSDFTTGVSSDYATTGSTQADQSWGGASSGPLPCNDVGALICFEQ